MTLAIAAATSSGVGTGLDAIEYPVEHKFDGGMPPTPHRRPSSAGRSRLPALDVGIQAAPHAEQVEDQLDELVCRFAASRSADPLAVLLPEVGEPLRTGDRVDRLGADAFEERVDRPDW